MKIVWNDGQKILIGLLRIYTKRTRCLKTTSLVKLLYRNYSRFFLSPSPFRAQKVTRWLHKTWPSFLVFL